MANKKSLEEQFKEFMENDFHHVCLNIEGMKKDISWLKWLICGISAAVLIRLALQYFGI